MSSTETILTLEAEATLVLAGALFSEQGAAVIPSLINSFLCQ